MCDSYGEACFNTTVKRNVPVSEGGYTVILDMKKCSTSDFQENGAIVNSAFY